MTRASLIFASSLLLAGCGDGAGLPGPDASLPLPSTDAAVARDLAEPPPDTEPLPATEVRIVAPSGKQVLSGPFAVVAEVHATAPVATVVATIGGNRFTLSPTTPGSNVYSASHVQPGGDGHLPLVVTVDTTTGPSARDELLIDYLASWPTLTIKAPLVDEVALGKLHVDAICNSALPGCRISVWSGHCGMVDLPYAMGDDHLDSMFAIDPAWDGQVLCLEAADRVGRRVTAQRRIRVETSTAYHRAYDVAEEILDANFQQTPWQIVRASRGWPTTYGASTQIDESQPMAIVHETNAAPTTSSIVFEQFDRAADRAFVGSSGGVLVLLSHHGLYSWNVREGFHQLEEQGATAPVINGDWAAFTKGPYVETYQFSTNTRKQIGAGASIDIGPNGVAAYTAPITGLCEGGELFIGGAKMPRYGVKRDVHTDGKLAVYREDCVGESTTRLALYDGSDEIVPWIGFGSPMDYRMNGGWLVALYSDASYLSPLFLRRDPQGIESGIPSRIYDSGVTLETVGADGSFTFLAGSSRYLVDAAGNVNVIGGSHGRSFWGAGNWYVVLGRSIFKIAT